MQQHVENDFDDQAKVVGHIASVDDHRSSLDNLVIDTADVHHIHDDRHYHHDGDPSGVDRNGTPLAARHGGRLVLGSRGFRTGPE